jgi:2-oxoglutarate dehydrogenase E1 component
MRNTEFLGAGDPGALEALFEGATRGGARRALAEAYRRWGWMAAELDPLRLSAPQRVPDLDATLYGLMPGDEAALERAYCGTIGWEIGHIQNPVRRDWLAGRAEAEQTAPDRQGALDLIAKAELFEAMCDRRMPGAKTFGLSGAEGYLVLVAEVLRAANTSGIERVVTGGMHRGRLTQMALLYGKPLARVVAEAQEAPEFPEEFGASSDSPYHLGWTGTSQFGPEIWISPHPSHLSVVAPVAMGRARAEQDQGDAVLSLALHTDAAFAGQGVNAEVLQLSELNAFKVGGTVHLILNNQIGFTTDAAEARTARTCADMAKLIEAPILHVNGEDPDALIRAAHVAVGYREAFGADIVIDCIAYRRKGHNEIDQPRFTQPDMYSAIDRMSPLSERYGAKAGLTPGIDDFRGDLDAAFEAAKTWRPNAPARPHGISPGILDDMLVPVATGVPADKLRAVGRKLTKLPDGFAAHPKVAQFLDARRTAIESGDGIDWATAEALAIASLADDGTTVRLGGQDSARGAFTQRHMTLHCGESAARHGIFDGFEPRPQIHDTPLTENAVLGFEYGYTLGHRDGLTIWEAQFGDFLNVCQAMFDQFIICGEDRWLFESNLVMLLPHGLDGGGPDHATAHPERLLAACARGNIQVVNLSTPANFFHALRRQVLAKWRKPLVVLAPKALLRHPGAKSALSDLSGTFQPVITRAGSPERVVMSTGKLSVLLEQANPDATLIRLEQVYPLPEQALRDALAPYPDAELIWAQEEPENMGYFQWLDRKLEAITGRNWRLVTRPASPAAASGPKKWDDRALKAVIEEAVGE